MDIAEANVLGLIPAHAGKTREPVHYGDYPGAHPRSRGENGIRRPRSDPSTGSSPLTRGKQAARFAADGDQGSSPLTRGKLVQAVLELVGEVAHPRSRGENGGVIIYPDGYVGSSPLTRGKRQVCKRKR